MKKKVIAVILILAGLFFTLAPHSVHVSLGFFLPHMYHVIGGIITLVIGACMLMKKQKMA